MDEIEFETAADATLGKLMDALDEMIGDSADVETQGGILTITFDDGRQYVINKHAPNRQLWMSSPKSGASHFDLDGEVWRSSRGGDALHQMLAAELSELSAIDIDPQSLT